MRLSVLVLALLAAACKTGPEPKPAATPELSSQELTVVEQDVSDFSLRLDGQVTCADAATVEKAHYELVADDKVLKSGDAALNVAVAAGGTSSFSIADKAQYAESAEALKALGEKEGDMLVALRGKLTVDVGGTKREMEFAKAKEVRTPRLPSVVMNEVDFGRYSGNEVGGTFYVGVKNPNPFTIHLVSLSYEASVNGKSLADGELGKGEKVEPSSTGVFEVPVQVNQETYGPEVDKLIKTKALPYQVKGELKGALFTLPYDLKGTVKLNESK
jgi:LEA14-like dessication related protein